MYARRVSDKQLDICYPARQSSGLVSDDDVLFLVSSLILNEPYTNIPTLSNTRDSFVSTLNINLY